MSSKATIEYSEQIANILALTLVGEADRILGEVPKVELDDIRVVSEESNKKVKYTVKGSFGNMLKNPSITIGLEFEYRDTVVQDELLARLVYEMYYTIKLSRLTK